MSLKKSAVFIALSLAALSSQAMASDGKVNFTGEIVDTPCVVSTDSQSIDVNLGQVKATHFVKANDTSPDADFKITLDECDITTLKTATIQFNGASTTDATLLAINSGADSATNVGIEIEDSTNTVLPLNTVSTEGYTLQAGESTLNFKAHYKAIAVPVTVGAANAQADFTVAYK